MNKEEFGKRIENIRLKLYKTALLYLGSEAFALDAVDEAVYKALCSYKKLRQREYFDTWITRILINECYNELRRQKRFRSIDELPESVVEVFDTLPLKEAIRRLSRKLKEVVILRYFAGCTLIEEVPLVNFHDTEVWLMPHYSHEWTAENPVVVVVQ